MALVREIMLARPNECSLRTLGLGMGVFFSFSKILGVDRRRFRNHSNYRRQFDILFLSNDVLEVFNSTP